MVHTVESRRRAYEKVKQRRTDWFEENGPCVVCGSTENLELDHINPETKVSHNIWSWSEFRRNEELQKCQVLCRVCHEAKTAEENRERNGGLRHGSETMYDKYKCRCDDCVRIKSILRQSRRNNASMV